LRPLLALAGGIWSPASDRRLNVLIFHRVRPVRDLLFPGEPDHSDFANCMQVVAEHFNCLTLDHAVDLLASSHPIPPRAVAISFDDGYADNCTEAMPILQRLDLKATFFVASGFLDGGCMWNDEAIELLRDFQGDRIDLRSVGMNVEPCATLEERRALIDNFLASLKYRESVARREALDALREITGGKPAPALMMTHKQLCEMRDAGMGIGGHTLGHPILARMNNKLASREIGEDRERLAAILGAPPKLFAYPNGKPGQDYRAEHAAMVRAAGYRAAFSTAWGAARKGVDLFQIPRFTPWDRDPTRFALRLVHNYTRTDFAKS